MTKRQIEAKGIEINFTATGLYWLSAPVGDINRGELALGRCKALPIALVFASEKGLYAASPEGAPVPTLLEWIDVWPGKDRK